MRQSFQTIIKCIWTDEYNRYSLGASMAGAIICYGLWHFLEGSSGFYFYSPYRYYPLQLFGIIFLLHVIIAVSSYRIDKIISNLLLSALNFYLLLIIILEVYYWVIL